MPKYFIFSIAQGTANMVRKLEKLSQHESYKEAKSQVKTLRLAQPSEDNLIYKIIFADSELDAEQKLQEKREAPIIREWEK